MTRSTESKKRRFIEVSPLCFCLIGRDGTNNFGFSDEKQKRSLCKEKAVRVSYEKPDGYCNPKSFYDCRSAGAVILSLDNDKVNT